MIVLVHGGKRATLQLGIQGRPSVVHFIISSLRFQYVDKVKNYEPRN